MREERKLVTVLAGDLVGSTPLGERLDPEEVKVIVGETVARFIRIVEEYGGTVKDVAGDGLMALFGAPVSHEDDAERAVRAGLEMIQETERQGREVAQAWGVEGLAVRVGIHTGEVVLGPAESSGRASAIGAFGDTLNTAARLQAVAAPNTVLVGESTRRLVPSLFEWGERGEFTLKGKRNAIVASAARAILAAGRRPRVEEGAVTRFVGREKELGRCRALLDAFRAGSGGVLFITGEPGIGKSRLSIELRARFQQEEFGRDGPVWLEGRCVSYGESLPYWPYRDLVREWLGVPVTEPEMRARVALRRQLRRWFGERGDGLYPYLGTMLGVNLESDALSRLAALSPEALQYRTFEVFRHLVERLAEHVPLVVAIEDLHWADPTSLQLAENLLPLTESSAVLFLFTQRLERDHPSWKFKETATREFPHRIQEIGLEPLSGAAERELLTSLIGPGALSPEIEERVLSQSEGNPFYLEEMVRSLMDADALVREGQRWTLQPNANVHLPPTVEKTILARIDRLGPPHRDVLSVASVLGRRFALPHLEGVLGGNGRLAAALHELQRLDLIREGRRWPRPEYRFKHSLIQEAAYRTILTPQRRSIHRQAAEWLEREYAGHAEEVTGLLAHHWLHAADEEKAIAYLTRAGDKARLEYALDEAIGYYEELLPLLERRRRRQQVALVLLKLALALHTSLRFKEANATYQKAFDYWEGPDRWTGTADVTLRVGQPQLAWDPDPTRSFFLQNIQLCMAMYDRLVERWPEATIVPSLAERWEISDDGLRYLFHLRKGLIWSDDVPISADDVAFAIKRVLDPAKPGDSASIYFVLENAQDYYTRRNPDRDRIGVRALDERTVEFRLVAPAPYFMSVVNRSDCGPLPRHAIERYGEQWTDLDVQPVSGPYRRVEWSPQRIVLERRPDYPRPRRGNVTRVEFDQASMPAIAQRYAAGQCHVADLRSLHDMSAIYQVAGEDAHPGPPAAGVYVVFDHAHPFLSRVEVRRALAHALDREALRQVVPPHVTVATGGVVPPPLQGHTPDIALRFDPDLARRYLHGLDLPPLATAVVEGTTSGRLFELAAGQWIEILGLSMEIKRILPADMQGIRDLRSVAPIFLGGWFPGYPDPEYFLRLLLHSEAKDNDGGFNYPPFDELIERARQERNDRARLELYHQADRMAVVDQVALIPLAYGRNVAFVQPWVDGWWEFGKSWSSFADLVVDPSAARRDEAERPSRPQARRTPSRSPRSMKAGKRRSSRSRPPSS
ncbi:MAG: ABC transporter substrate-binding protein [bacterium]